MKTVTTTRREFITLLGGAAALAWPRGARAQQSSKIWQMGFIARGHETFYDALFEGLRELGYVEGRNLIVERRYAGDRTDKFQEFAAEMVRLNVDIIYSGHNARSPCRQERDYDHPDRAPERY